MLTRRALLASALAPENPLRPRPLGRSGLLVPPLSYGVEEITDPTLLTRALDAGITHFFSFSNYELIGRALGPHRHRVTLSAGTKAYDAPTFRRDLERVLRELNVDHIDLWYLASRLAPEHLPDPLLTALDKARSEGLVRAYGATSHRVALVLPRILETRIIQVLMVAANFTVWRQSWTLIGESFKEDERPAQIAKARAAGLGIVAMKPMLGGLKFHPPEHKAWLNSLDTDEKRRPVLAAALRWATRHPALDTALVHMPTHQVLEENLASLRLQQPEEDARLLAQTLEQIQPYYCRMCQRCAGQCPQGLPVEDLHRYLLYAQSYGQPRRARALFAALPAPHRQPVCRSCPSCAVRCPNGVRVRDRLIQAQELLG